ncbi:DUF2399 domain-containing protein [Laceyella putida]|uniref:DUF2399 domain-containing protein n=1 Tax=Laceyella putida TaxID=110101 RepID=A0ABW2RPT1_9BACL
MPILLCKPSVAILRLIELFLEQEEPAQRLCYSGDFDVASLQVTLALANRFAPGFVPWWPGADTYKCWSVHGPTLSQEEKERLQRMEIPWDTSLPITMAHVGRKIVSGNVCC